MSFKSSAPLNMSTVSKNVKITVITLDTCIYEKLLSVINPFIYMLSKEARQRWLYTVTIL